MQICDKTDAPFALVLLVYFTDQERAKYMFEVIFNIRSIVACFNLDSFCGLHIKVEQNSL